MKRLAAFLAALAVPAAPAGAQGFEVSALAGYTTAGGLEPKAVGVSELKLASGFSWGGSAAWFLSPRLGVEASWTRHESGLEIGTRDGSARLFDVNVDQFHGGVVWRLRSDLSRLRPFLAAGAGASRFSAPLLQPETKLSFGLGAGVKWMPTRRAGVRLQGRYAPVRLGDAESDYCDPFGFCQGWLQQLELSAGVVVGFRGF